MQTEETRRTAIPQQLEQKPHYRKLIKIKNHKVMPQTKRQYKTPGKQLNEVERENLSEKELRKMIVKTIQDLKSRMEKMQEMFTKT